MIINLTPHAITIFREGDEPLVIQPTAPSARVRQEFEEDGTVESIPVVRAITGQVENLPDPAMDTIYVVSALVAQQCQDRNDVYAPDTSPSGAVRDDKGLIVGVKGLVRY